MLITLRLITECDLTDPLSIDKLTEWRIENRYAYKGSYEITKESISNWLKTYIIGNPDRFLFWIIVEYLRIGHIGIKNIAWDSVEIDNLARGVDLHKGAMSQALQMMVHAYSDRNIYLRVLANNINAIKFYQKNGFTKKSLEGEFIRMEYEA